MSFTLAAPSTEVTTGSSLPKNPVPAGDLAVRPWCDWRQFLDLLDGLPLIPCGAGPLGKAPIDPRNGRAMNGWNVMAFTPEQIMTMGDVVKSVGIRPGPDAGFLLILDIDGSTAMQFCVEGGCSFAEKTGWSIYRTTSDERLKKVFFVPEAYRKVFNDETGQPIGKAIMTTKPAVYGTNDDGVRELLKPAEQIELFYAGGQCIVLGAHVSSGGYYYWQGNPDEITEPTPEWWSLINKILNHRRTEISATRSQHPTSSVVHSGPSSPCPICGRDHSAACTTYTDGERLRVNCFHGQTFSPPTNLKPGDITLIMGRKWAYCKDFTNSAIGDYSTFIEHQPTSHALHAREIQSNSILMASDPKIELHEITPALSSHNKMSRHTLSPLTLTPDQVLSLLPRKLGETPRHNIRTNEFSVGQKIFTADDANRLYLTLCDSTSRWDKGVTSDAFIHLASQNSFDPVEEYLNYAVEAYQPLNDEQWYSLDKYLLGIEDPIAKYFLPRYFVSAVARVYRPGCSVRRSPVFIGAQCRGKTRFGNILFGDEYWVEGISNLEKDDLMRLQSAWGVELSELDGITRRRDQEALKAFLTSRQDTFRLPYAKSVQKFDRRCVFWGTANQPPLNDLSGSTRFVCIPLPDKMLPLDWANENRDALWCRAAQEFRRVPPNQETWDIFTEQERSEISDRNSNHQEQDPWLDDLQKIINVEKLAGRLPVTVTFILDQMDIQKSQQNNAASKRVRGLLESLGWVYTQRRPSPGINPKKGFWPG